MIPFNIPPQVGTELDYMRQAMANNKICGDGPFTRRCDEWMEQRFHAGKVLLTTSGYTETPNLDAPRWKWLPCCAASSPATR